MNFVFAVPVLPVRDVIESIFFYQAIGLTLLHADKLSAVFNAGSMELHVRQVADRNWETATATGVNPVVSGNESFLAGTAVCRIGIDGISDFISHLASLELIHPEEQSGTAKDLHVHDLDGNRLIFFDINA